MISKTLNKCSVLYYFLFNSYTLGGGIIVVYVCNTVCPKNPTLYVLRTDYEKSKMSNIHRRINWKTVCKIMCNSKHMSVTQLLDPYATILHSTQSNPIHCTLQTFPTLCVYSAWTLFAFVIVTKQKIIIISNNNTIGRIIP